MQSLDCFKAYDVRGVFNEELDGQLSVKIGRAFACFLKAKTVVIGGDNRFSTPTLKKSLRDGLNKQGVDVIDIGMCGTEEIYYATRFLNADGGIMVTASHNPKNYNGMKFVREGSKPISGDTGLNTIKQLVVENNFTDAPQRGKYQERNILEAYVSEILKITHVLTEFSKQELKPLKIVVNAGNGAAGHVVDALEESFALHRIPFEFIKIHHESDGNFPHGVPNPMLPENRKDTQQAVLQHKADFGIAWDGDFDRCFLFDERGEFIEGYYIVGLLASMFLKKYPNEPIIYDPRLTWNTEDIVSRYHGKAIQSKTGHAFIKERMRKENAVYGGEMSAHHYFRHFAYCDSGMIPWLIIAGQLSKSDVTLSQLVARRIAEYPSSGEINRKIKNPIKTLSTIKQYYSGRAESMNEIDGLSVEFKQWRFNIRSSNTEPLVRLNVESKFDKALMISKTQEVLQLMSV